MPVQHALTVNQGATSQLLLVYVRDASQPALGKTGLRQDSPGARAAFVREGDKAKEIRMTPGTFGAWGPNAWVEVDPDTMPGVYQFGLPDDLLAEGSPHAVLGFRFDGALVDPIDIELVAYDPQETYSIGIQQLANKHRHAFLRQFMTGLTENSYERGEGTQRQLTTTLRAKHPTED